MIQVLQRADEAIRIISICDEIPLGQIAAAMGIRKTTLSNILATLNSLGYVRKSVVGQYSIGERLKNLAYPHVVRDAVVGAAGMIVDELAAKTGEHTVCCMVQNGKIALIAKAESNQTITVNSSAFEEYSPYGTASGRVLMSYMDTQQQEDFLERFGMPGKFWEEIKSPDALRNALHLIRQAGLAEKTAKDGQAVAMAVPVFGPDKKAWAAMGICLPSMRFTEDKKKSIPADLRSAAEKLSKRLSANS